jgi:hypothetical protein
VGRGAGSAGDDVEIAIVVHVAPGKYLGWTAESDRGIGPVLEDAGGEGHVLECAVLRVPQQPNGARAPGGEVVRGAAPAARHQISPTIAVEVDSVEANALGGDGIEPPCRGGVLERLSAGLPTRCTRIADRCGQTATASDSRPALLPLIAASRTQHRYAENADLPDDANAPHCS